MPEFIYLIHPYRHEFFEKPTPKEEAIMEEHNAYLQQAAEQGIVLLAGPCLDESFGIVILRAESEAAAREFMYADPSVQQNVMMAEMHPLRLAIANAGLSNVLATR